MNLEALNKKSVSLYKKSFLEDDTLSDELFLKLLRRYSWDGKDFFQSSDNDKVSRAFIKRFGKNQAADESINFSALSFVHLVTNCINATLIETLAYLEPIQKALKNTKDANYKIITAIATNYLTPKKVLKMLIDKSNSYVKTLIAMRDGCHQMMQNALYEDADEVVLNALSHNPNLDNDIAIKLIFDEQYAKNIAKYIRLDEEIFEILVDLYPLELSQNESINFEMQKRLFEMDNKEIRASLSLNRNIDGYIAAEFVCDEDDNINYNI